MFINELISSISTVLEMKSGYNVLCAFNCIVNRIVSGEIYTTGKNFTLPPWVTQVTNSTSGSRPQSLLPSTTKQPQSWKIQNMIQIQYTNNIKYNKHLFIFPPERAIGRWPLLKYKNTPFINNCMFQSPATLVKW